MNDTFNPASLPDIFPQIERRYHANVPHCYVVKSDEGSTVAVILWTRSKVMNIEIDNFPHDKRYFSSDIPIRSLDEFVSDMARIGLKLEPRSSSVAADKLAASKKEG